MFKKIITILIVLLLIVGGIGFWYLNRNTYSKEILKIEVLGPERTKVGEEIEYIVKYRNNGNVRLEVPKLVFEYPQYAEIPENREKRVELSSKEIGDAIYPGEEKTFRFKTRLFGKKGEDRTAKASLTYSPKNLNSSYKSVSSLTTIIEEVPLSFEFDLPSKVESAQEFTFQINYFSNIDYPISDLAVKVEYPDDFEFISAEPTGIEKTTWNIGLLNKADGGRIEIIGNLRGDVGDRKIMNAKLGIWREDDFVHLKEITKGIELIEPSLYITQQINGNPKYVASPGDMLHYELFFKNIGDDPLTKAFLIFKMQGDAYDLSTLKSDKVDFGEGDNSIIFDWRKVSKLQFLEAKKEGMVEFWIELKDDWGMEGENDKNPILTNQIYLSQVEKEFEIKVNTKAELVQSAYSEKPEDSIIDDEEIFENSGPHPLEEGESSTYTVVWELKNYYNDLENTIIKATLPEDVEMTGNIYPEEDGLTYDSDSRELVWDAEKVEAGTGFTEDSRKIAFQLEITPETEKSEYTLIEKGEIKGSDQFTEKDIEQKTKELKVKN